MSISTKPASGFRDFLPQQARLRARVFNVIREVYESYGFDPLETPCFERLSTLLGKYGDEGDQLLFRVLHRGQKLAKAIEAADTNENTLAELGLRYDLTVPLARIYAQYRNELPSFFKRYQIAPVWRADRPQKGRFREFYQCDVDVVGSTSMTVEAEVTAALAEVLRRLEFGGVRIHVNHRGLLRAIILKAGVPVELETEALVAIDKLDKIGKDGVIKELGERGISEQSVQLLMDLIGITTQGEPGSFTNAQTLTQLREALGDIEQGAEAISQLEDLLRYAQAGPSGPLLYIDPSLARGLSYYTGPIFEIRSDDFAGSLGGGGRYDGLIGMFSKQSVPACGFSLGVERILVLMEERGMSEVQQSGADVMVTLWDDDFTPQSMALAQELRVAGFNVDVYPAHDKYKKQFKYANERHIPKVIVFAPREHEKGEVGIKNMATGEQITVARDALIEALRTPSA